MNIHTLEQLADAIAVEIVWRKKELTALKLMIQSGNISNDKKTALLRGSIALLYAHWEGFVKSSSKMYLEYVHFQRLSYNKLAYNFVAIGLRGLLVKAANSNKPQQHIDVVEFFKSKLNDISVIPYKDGVNTKSNLSSKVLRDIMDGLGLSYSEFETKEQLLDELLLERRNTIAHGEYLILTLDSYIYIHDQVVEMIEHYRTQIENAAALRKYASAN